MNANTARTMRTSEDQGRRDYCAEADGYREIECPLMRGDVIAAERCLASMEAGCRCGASRRALRGVMLARRPDLGNFPDPSIEEAARQSRQRVARMLQVIGAAR